MKVNGKTVKDMDWVWKRGGDGYTEGNGRKDSKEDTVFVNRIPPQLNMRERGRMDCKMDTDRRRMPTTVSRPKTKKKCSNPDLIS